MQAPAEQRNDVVRDEKIPEFMVKEDHTDENLSQTNEPNIYST